MRRSLSLSHASMHGQDLFAQHAKQDRAQQQSR
jgi:hypothetical protein